MDEIIYLGITEKIRQITHKFNNISMDVKLGEYSKIQKLLTLNDEYLELHKRLSDLNYEKPTE